MNSKGDRSHRTFPIFFKNRFTLLEKKNMLKKVVLYDAC